ncbi:hypothetical protein BLNAU_24045 [Blattamonas nauphoetae]|uniref:Uncharacterized protein n=1 Tax=Blattamonas nauphoetae TaxID=2049346 RepID=A0ABQ9WNI2_9EUKA|nr:hypothetical protein BLNAU_24045 [Blattamonas nauphoetae]
MSQVSYSTRSKPTSTDQHPDFFPSVRSFHDRISRLRSEESRENNRFKKATSSLHHINTDWLKTLEKISHISSRCYILRIKLSKLLMEGGDTSITLGISSERLAPQSETCPPAFDFAQETAAPMVVHACRAKVIAISTEMISMPIYITDTTEYY